MSGCPLNVQAEMAEELTARGLDAKGLRAELEQRLKAVMDGEEQEVREAAYAEMRGRLDGSASAPAYEPTAADQELLTQQLPADLSKLSKVQVSGSKRTLS